MKNPFRSTTSPTSNQPIEVGTVAWKRDLTEALTLSREQRKPVFALFQEVPGCAGCQQFGAEVLSHPLIVEAIETLFVPLLIHNNAPGRDAEVLATYKEPAWNFQVVRFLDEDGVDIIERRDKVWTTGPLAARMIATLEATGSEAPAYLRLLEQEHSGRLETAYLVQSCFWVGEMELGKIDGVVTTEAGFMDGDEVTAVQFDPAVTTLEKVATAGAHAGVVSAVFADASVANGYAARTPLAYRRAPDSDQKRQLNGRRPTGHLTNAQATKLNAFTSTSAEQADSFLAPSQR